MHQVSFYTSANGTSPIKKFLDSCQLSLRIKILRQLKYVEEYGLNSAIPNIKKITGTRFWELRVLGRDNIRVICVSLKEEEIKVLHIFRKKKRKTPVREINISYKRYQDCLNTSRHILHP